MLQKKERNQPEHHEQVQFIKFLEREKTMGRVLKFSATLNGVWLPEFYFNKMRAAGLRSGPSDVIILLKEVMLWVELKLPKRIKKNGEEGSSPSSIIPEQIEWMNILNTYPQVHATISYGAQEAIRFTSSFIPNAGIYTISEQTDKERDKSLQSFNCFLNGDTAL